MSYRFLPSVESFLYCLSQLYCKRGWSGHTFLMIFFSFNWIFFLVHYSQNSIVFHKGFEEIITIFMKSYIPLQGQIFSSCFLTNCIAWGVKAVTLLKISFFVIKIRRNKNIFRPRPISNRIQNMFSKSQNHRHESGRNWERGIRWFCWTGHPQSSKLDSHQYLRLAQIWNDPVVR